MSSFQEIMEHLLKVLSVETTNRAWLCVYGEEQSEEWVSLHGWMGFREVLHELSPFGRRMLSCDSQNSLNTRRAFVYKKCYSIINEIPSEMEVAPCYTQ